MTPARVTVDAAELAALRRIKAAALALAMSECRMRATLRGDYPDELHEEWPEADALVVALKVAP